MPNNDPVDPDQPRPEGLLAGELSKKYLHPEAEDLLTMVGNPELIERYFSDSFELERQMSDSGYRLIDWGMVTIGWGKKIGRHKEHHPTQALIRFSAEPTAVYNIGIGSEGNYTLTQVLDIRSDRQRVDEVLRFSSYYVNTAISQSVKSFIHEQWQLNVDDIDH